MSREGEPPAPGGRRGRVDGPRVAILGAGPVGLDAALAAAARGWPFTVYEAGPRPAHHVRRWGHVEMFSPWALNVSPRMRRRLEAEGLDVPGGEARDDCPRATDYVERVLEPVAALPEVARRLRTGTRVAAVGRAGLLKHEAIASDARAARPFRILLEEEGGRRTEEADVVLDCTGAYGNPNATGDGGIPAPGEEAVEGRIERHVPDVRGEPDRWREARVLLVGAGHSAQTVVGELAELAGDGRASGAGTASRDGSGAGDGFTVHWVLRSEDPDWNRVPDDPLPARDRVAARAEALAADPPPWLRLHTGRVVDALRPEGDGVAARLRPRNGAAPDRDPGSGPGAGSPPGAGRTAAGETVTVDRIVSLTGYVGDHTLYRQLQVHECYATSGPMNLAARLLESDTADCLDQESHGADALASPEPDFYLLGHKSYGRNNTFLLTVGWDQVTEVFGALEGR